MRGDICLKCREALQKALNELEAWAITNNLKFKKNKCQILHLGQGNPDCMYRLVDERLESGPTERNLRFWLTVN